MSALSRDDLQGMVCNVVFVPFMVDGCIASVASASEAGHPQVLPP